MKYRNFATLCLSATWLALPGCAEPDLGTESEIAEAQQGLEYKSLTVSDGAAGDMFGISVSQTRLYNEAVLLVGAYLDDSPGRDSGSAYLYDVSWPRDLPFERIPPVTPTKLTAPDGAAYDYFGKSVSVEDDVAAIGAHGDDDKGSSSGSAHVYRRSGSNWYYDTKLVAPDGAAADYFGNDLIATSNGTLRHAIVGAYGDDDGGSLSGSAYVFKKEGTGGWTFAKKLVASDGHAGQNFGRSFAATTAREGNAHVWLAVGAPGDRANGSQAGAVYVYERHQGGNANWGLVRKIVPNDAHGTQLFGQSVAFFDRAEDSYLVVGAPYDNNYGPYSGAAYVFKRNLGGTNHWGQFAKLVPDDGATSDRFGETVTAYGSALLVAAPFDDDQGTDSGSIYYYDWNAVQGNAPYIKHLAPLGRAGDWFGFSMSGGLVGAPRDDMRATDAGAGYWLNDLASP